MCTHSIHLSFLGSRDIGYTGIRSYMIMDMTYVLVLRMEGMAGQDASHVATTNHASVCSRKIRKL